MSRLGRLFAAGTLAQAVSLAPLAWALLTGDRGLPETVWRLGAGLGLAGVALQAGALVATLIALAAGSCRRPLAAALRGTTTTRRTDR